MTTTAKLPAADEHRLRGETAVTAASDAVRALTAFEREGRPISPRVKADMLRVADRLLALGRRYQNAAQGIRETPRDFMVPCDLPDDLPDAEIDRRPPIDKAIT